MADVPRRAAFLATLALLPALAGCGGSADDMLDTARLEELQNNPTHARQIYEDLVRRYPGTPEAAQAQERLRALGEPK
jgi:TolA-binding protein